jgi:CheY-like chemotaxis protein
MSTRKALVVDDEPLICRICARTLGDDGYAVDTASNGIEAGKMLDGAGYDVCLLDIRSPGMNGMDFFRYLGGTHPELCSRVLFITGDTMSGSIEQFLRETATRCLMKPFTPKELKEAVRSIVTGQIGPQVNQ